MKSAPNTLSYLHTYSASKHVKISYRAPQSLTLPKCVLVYFIFSTHKKPNKQKVDKMF